MYAKWIGGDVYLCGELVIKDGDIRKVQAKDKDMYIIEGQTKGGTYGWTHASNLELLNSIETEVDGYQTDGEKREIF